MTTCGGSREHDLTGQGRSLAARSRGWPANSTSFARLDADLQRKRADQQVPTRSRAGGSSPRERRPGRRHGCAAPGAGQSAGRDQRGERYGRGRAPASGLPGGRQLHEPPGPADPRPGSARRLARAPHFYTAGRYRLVRRGTDRKVRCAKPLITRRSAVQIRPPPPTESQCSQGLRGFGGLASFSAATGCLPTPTGYAATADGSTVLNGQRAFGRRLWRRHLACREGRVGRSSS